MPDHDVLFSQLRERVHEKISPHVVVLNSRDCNTGNASVVLSAPASFPGFCVWVWDTLPKAVPILVCNQF